MTLMEEAIRGRVPPSIAQVAGREGIDPAKLARLVAAGRVSFRQTSAGLNWIP